MLIGLDEHPLHQITQSFAGVAGSDSAVERRPLRVPVRRRRQRVPDVQRAAVPEQRRPRRLRLPPPRRPPAQHPPVPPAAARHGPLRRRTAADRDRRADADAAASCSRTTSYGIACDVLCRSTVLPYEDPVEVTRIDGRLLSERATYELVGACEGWVEVGGQRYELTPATSSFFRNHSWGNQAGRGGPRYGAPRPPRRVPGVRQWVLFRVDSHGGFYFSDPSGRAASGKGAILLADGSVPVTGVEHELEFYDGGRRVEAARSGSPTPRASSGRTRSPTSAGSTARAAGTSAASTTGSARASTAATSTSRARSGTSAHPTQIVDEAGDVVRVRPRLGRELRAPAARRRDRPRPLRVRRDPRPGRMSDERHRTSGAAIDGSMDGQVAVVTGAASGIGAAIAERFVEEGARCVLVDIQDDAGHAVAGRLGDARHVRPRGRVRRGRRRRRDRRRRRAVRPARLRGQQRRHPRRSRADRRDRRRRVAAHDRRAPGQRVLRHQARGAGDDRAGGGGSIINMASTAGVRAGLGPHVYTAAKHGVVGLTQSVAPELGRHGIRVNAIAPGRHGHEPHRVRHDGRRRRPRGGEQARRQGRDDRPAGRAARHRQRGAVPRLGRSRPTSAAPCSSSTPPAR